MTTDNEALTYDHIVALALEHGFKLKPQVDGRMALNDYVIDFARVVYDIGQATAEAEAAAGTVGEIEELTQEVVQWANSAFPDRKPQSALLKLFEETGELVRDPSDAGEYADIFIMLFDLADMHGVDVAKAIRDKLALNRQRTWTKTATGTLQHIAPTGRPDTLPADHRESYTNGVADVKAGLSRRAHGHKDIDNQHWYNRGYDMGIGE